MCQTFRDRTGKQVMARFARKKDWTDGFRIIDEVCGPQPLPPPPPASFSSKPIFFVCSHCNATASETHVFRQLGREHRRVRVGRCLDAGLSLSPQSRGLHGHLATPAEPGAPQVLGALVLLHVGNGGGEGRKDRSLPVSGCAEPCSEFAPVWSVGCGRAGAGVPLSSVAPREYCRVSQQEGVCCNKQIYPFQFAVCWRLVKTQLTSESLTVAENN